MTARSVPAVQAGAAGTRYIAGVEYAVLTGFRPLLLDLILPPAESGGPGSGGPASGGPGRPVPVVAWLHGGGWQQGSRRSAGPAFAGWSPTVFERIAAAGLAVAAIDYRLSGEARWPAQLADVLAALDWLRREGPELGLDPGRLALMGESAGGHLAAVAALTDTARTDGAVTDGALPDGAVTDGAVTDGALADGTLTEGIVTDGTSKNAAPGALAGALRAVVDWYGPADLRTMASEVGPAPAADPAAPDSRESRLLGAPLPTVPDIAADASPVTHIHPAAPPFLLLHGTADRLVPVLQSTGFAAALREAGVPVQLELIAGAGHMWLAAGPGVTHRVFGLSLDFLCQHLLDGGRSGPPGGGVS
jgi:acetyl esterase/lipase